MSRIQSKFTHHNKKPRKYQQQCWDATDIGIIQPRLKVVIIFSNK